MCVSYAGPGDGSNIGRSIYAHTSTHAHTLVPVDVRVEVEPALELRGQLRHVRLGEHACFMFYFVWGGVDLWCVGWLVVGRGCGVQCMHGPSGAVGIQ